MTQDYILRLLEQLGAIVATISGKRAAGDVEGAERELADQCVRHTGLPLVVVRQASPAELDGLLAMGGAFRTPRAMILAELLQQSAALAEARGNPLAAATEYAQAEHLVRGALPNLSGDELVSFREKQRFLATKLRDLAGGSEPDETQGRLESS